MNIIYTLATALTEKVKEKLIMIIAWLALFKSEISSDLDSISHGDATLVAANAPIGSWLD